MEESRPLFLELLRKRYSPQRLGRRVVAHGAPRH